MMCAFYQFMKFIEKLGTGELSVQDNKVSHLFFSSIHFFFLSLCAPTFLVFLFSSSHTHSFPRSQGIP